MVYAVIFPSCQASKEHPALATFKGYDFTTVLTDVIGPNYENAVPILYFSNDEEYQGYDILTPKQQDLGMRFPKWYHTLDQICGYLPTSKIYKTMDECLAGEPYLAEAKRVYES